MLKCLNEYLIYKHSIYIYIYVLNNNILIYHFRCCLKISHRHKRTFYKYCLNEYLIYKHNIYIYIYIYIYINI